MNVPDDNAAPSPSKKRAANWGENRWGRQKRTFRQAPGARRFNARAVRGWGLDRGQQQKEGRKEGAKEEGRNEDIPNSTFLYGQSVHVTGA